MVRQLDGIGKFPSRQLYFVEIGMKIVEATGDKTFRSKLKQQWGSRS
jgi:hypothetical protein